MKKKIIASLLTLLTLAVLALPAFAQDAHYTLRLRRDFGTGLGSRIEGRFTLSVSAEESALQSVRYTLDGVEIANAQEAPFRYSFNTHSFADGGHRLGAQITLKDGQTVNTPEVAVYFLSGSEARKAIVGIMVPIIGISLAAVLISFLIQSAAARKAKAAGLQAELVRPSVCKHCGQPFSRPLIGGFNVLTGKLMPCPHCGKWQVAKAASAAEVQAALAKTAPQAQAPSIPTETLQREALEDSKYIDDINK